MPYAQVCFTFLYGMCDCHLCIQLPPPLERELHEDSIFVDINAKINTN